MTEPATTDQVFIKKLTEIILADLGNETFGVKELAQESGMSLYSLNRRLNAINKKTGTQFIREVRLKKALEMLKYESLTASEISFRVGFSSPAYFNICFSEFFGYPPGKIKKESLAGTEENILNQRTAKHEQKKTIRQAIVSLLPWILLVCTFIVIAVLFVFYIQNKRQSRVLAKLEKSIAVLPFTNDSPNDSTTYFMDGVMEEILNNLQKIKDFRVLSRTSTEQYRGSTKLSLPKIAKELGVNYIVEAGGQKYGNTFRLRVQLIKAAKEGHLWAESYEKEIRETKDIYGIQSEIAQSITSALKATLTPEEKQIIDKIPTTDLIAYDLYQKANNYKKDYQKTRNISSYQNAITFYKAAIEIDSTFAKAYTGWASTYFERYNSENFIKKGNVDTCLAMVNKALSLDNQLDEAYYIKGWYYQENGHIKEALDNYNEALRINPNYSDAYFARGYVFQITCDYVGYIDNFQRALKLISGDQRPSFLENLGEAYADVGFNNKAKYFYHEAFALDSNKARYSNDSAFIELCFGNNEESGKLNKKVPEIDSTNIDYPWYIPGKSNEWNNFRIKKIIEYHKKRGESFSWLSHRMGWALFQVGKKKEAEYYFNQEIKYCEESIKLGRSYATWGHAYYDMAGTYAFLGDKVKAYKYLDEWSMNFQPLFMINIFKGDPLFAGIQKEDRFQKITQNVEAKYQAEHERVRKWLVDQGML
ncbi:MAG: helix-turn-helix domain-containing protein [Bacteroidales bacterium]